MIHVSPHVDEASQTPFNPQTLFRNVLRTSLDAVFVSAPGGRLIDCNDAALALLGYDDGEQLKAVPADDLCADPASRRGLTRAVEETGLVERYPVTLRRKDGSTLHALITSAAMTDEDGKLTGFVGTIRDLTDWQRAEEARRQRTHEQSFLYRAALAFGSTQHLEDLLGIIVREVGRGLPAGQVSVWLKEEGDRLVCEACSRLHGDEPEDRGAAAGRGLVTWVADHGKRLIMPPDEQGFCCARPVEDPGDLDRPPALVVPLVAEEKVMGVLQATARHGEGFEASDRTLLESLGPLAAASIWNAQRYEAAQAEIQACSHVETIPIESERRFRELAELLPEAVFEADRKNRLTYANRRALDLFGYSLDDMRAGLSGFDTIAPEDRTKAVENMSRRLRGETSPVPYTGIKKDGSTFPMLMHTTPITGDDGILGIRGVIVDLTEQVRDQQRLRSSEARYRTLVEASLQGVVIAQDDPLRLAFASLPMETITGYSPAELTGFKPDQLAALIHPNDRNRFLQSFRARLAGDSVPSRQIYRVIHKSGETRWVELHSTRIDYEGSPATQTAFVDITERKEMEAALRESEERYRQLVELSPDLIAIHCGGRMVYINDAGIDLLGAGSADDIIGRPVTDFVAPGQREASEERMRRLARSATRSPVYEQTVSRPDGTTRDIEVIGVPFTSKKGSAVQIMARDITDRREMEKQLRQQERLAAVGQMAAGIAHDFNNILGTITLYAQMPLRASPLTPRVREALEAIVEESLLASNLVDQIRDFSRNAPLPTEPVNISIIIDEALTLLRRTLPEDIHVATNLPPEACVVEADPTRIHQMLTNLALNARDAMPGGGELHVTLSQISVPNEGPPPVPGMPMERWWARLDVADTGCGITEEVEAHLFEPYFTTKEREGTGLGLAQVYGIVKQHQGYIDVETAVGGGTTFSVYFPLTRDQTDNEAGSGDKGGAVRPPIRGRGERILVVEDAEQLSRAVRRGLESLGYRVLVAADGRGALELLEAQEVDLVLTDLVMPGMGGSALVKRIHQRWPDLTVVAMTGHVSDAVLAVSPGAGFDNVIEKPFSIENLARTLRKALGHQ